MAGARMTPASGKMEKPGKNANAALEAVTRIGAHLTVDRLLWAPQNGHRMASRPARWFDTVSLFSEKRVFLDEEGYLPQYVRFQLEPCDLHSSEPARSVRCYPTVKLYSSGVMLLSLRLFSRATLRVLRVSVVNPFTSAPDDPSAHSPAARRGFVTAESWW
jgi:hypothetical protein